MPLPGESIHGRGAAENPPNRFGSVHLERDADPEGPAPQTEFLRDRSRSILTRNDSPDVGFEVSVNPYRGCEHGCSYCYARPTHEFLGFSAGLDFETRIVVKEDAPALLREELAAAAWMPRPVAMSGITDPYQPVERRLGITRGCLQVFAECRNPVVVITKNRLVTRDIDLLGELARHQAAAVLLSVTTLDRGLARVMEPRTSTPEDRLAAVEALTRAGVPTGVMIAPVIPGLTDHEIPSILDAAAKAGAKTAHYVLLRLPLGVAPLFEAWLSRHAPERKEKVLHRLREMRDGRLNDPRFGSRMRGQGVYAEEIRSLFTLAKRRAGIADHLPALSVESFRRPWGPQLTLFP